MTYYFCDYEELIATKKELEKVKAENEILRNENEKLMKGVKNEKPKSSRKTTTKRKVQ